MDATNPHQSTIPEEGEMMLLTFHQERTSWRPVIYIGPPSEPNNASEIWVGEWRRNLRKAQVSGLKQYFEMYEERYGFRHPQDPYRTRSDGVLPANVITCHDGRRFDTYTADEMPERIVV